MLGLKIGSLNVGIKTVSERYAEFLEFRSLSSDSNNKLESTFFKRCSELTEIDDAKKAYNKLASGAQLNKYCPIQNSANMDKKYDIYNIKSKEEFLAEFEESIKKNKDYEKYISKVIQNNAELELSPTDVVNNLGLFAYAITSAIQDLLEDKEFMAEYEDARNSAVYDSAKKLKMVAELIGNSGCDVVAIQEIDETSFRVLGEMPELSNMKAHYHSEGGFFVKQDYFAMLMKMANLVELENINDETQYLMLVSGGDTYLIANTHLTSCGKNSEKVKGVNYESQADKLFSVLERVGNGDGGIMKICAVGDFNHIPEPANLSVASPPITTYKIRSYFQTQARKAGIVAEGIRTHVVYTSNVKVSELKSLKFNMEPFDKSKDIMIPNIETPTDHLFVTAQIE
jgi:hypothetical protein